MTAVDTSLWQRIDRYLDDALDLAPAEREPWLADLATTQPDIAELLSRLLAERDALHAAAFLERSPFSRTAIHASMSGQRIGAYRIERLLGRGGMGEVWLAARSDGHFEAQYAIKVLDSEIAQPKLVQRFRCEGRLLARLVHPHIARLIDAGTTSDERQYLVLEYVDGERIDRYCDSHRLGVKARVRLFLDVVSAVAHAHANLIVHRDIKPSNVFVTRDGAVKLLDFGIAKLLGPEQSNSDPAVTRLEESALTPDYAAPEQLLGELPSTATDVHQLGMLLYVLLTGGHPIPSSGSRAERIRAALDRRLPRASELVSGPLRAELRGDLDAILSMALRTDPNERYPTVAAFGDDLARYLNLEPVSARRGAMLYRARKFGDRHRLAVVISGTAIAGLCAALVFAFWQGRLAARERDHAFSLATRNTAVTEFLGTLITEAAESDKPITVSTMLERGEELARANRSGSPEDRAAVLEMIASRYGALGDYTKAASLLESAVSLVTNSRDVALHAELNCVHAFVLANLGDPEAALHTISEEISRLDGDPQNAAYCLLYRSMIALDNHDGVNGYRDAEQALSRFQAAPHTSAADEGLFLGAVAMGHHLNGRNAEADRYFAEAMRKYREVGRDRSQNAMTVRNNWATVVEGAGAPKRALGLYDDILQTLKAQNPQGQPSPAYVGNRGRALEAIGRYDEARSAYEQELQVADEKQNHTGRAHALYGLASIAQLQHDPIASRKYLEQLAAALARVPSDGPPWLARTIVQARLDLDDGQFDVARTEFARVLDKEVNSALAVNAELGKAEAELLGGDAVVAEADARRALEMCTSMQGGIPYSAQTGQAWLLLGRALRTLGDERRAHDAFDQAIVHLSKTVDDTHPQLARARVLATETQQSG